jgi:hypothetical protein
MILTPDEMKELEITLGLTKPETVPGAPQVAMPEPPQLAHHRLKQGRFSDDELAQIAAALGV